MSILVEEVDLRRADGQRRVGRLHVDRRGRGDRQCERAAARAVGGEERAAGADIQTGRGRIAAAVVVVDGHAAVEIGLGRILVEGQHTFGATAADDAEDALVGAGGVKIEDIVRFHPEDSALGIDQTSPWHRSAGQLGIERVDHVRVAQHEDRARISEDAAASLELIGVVQSEDGAGPQEQRAIERAGSCGCAASDVEHRSAEHIQRHRCCAQRVPGIEHHERAVIAEKLIDGLEIGALRVHGNAADQMHVHFAVGCIGFADVGIERRDRQYGAAVAQREGLPVGAFEGHRGERRRPGAAGAAVIDDDVAGNESVSSAIAGQP